MSVVFLDVETKKSFSGIEGHDPGELGVSFVGVYRRGEGDGFLSFFEPDLPKLWPVLEKAELVVGFNIIKFDWPALNPFYPGDLLKLPTLDLLEVVKDSLGRRLRLDNLGQATLGKGKIGNGWEAIEYYRQEKWQELEKYCLMDVEITRDLYDFGQKNGFWRYREMTGEIGEFKIKWPEQKKTESVGLTLGI